MTVGASEDSGRKSTEPVPVKDWLGARSSTALHTPRIYEPERVSAACYSRPSLRSASGIQFGGRFSPKAAMPSRASGPRKSDQSIVMRSGLP